MNTLDRDKNGKLLIARPCLSKEAAEAWFETTYRKAYPDKEVEVEIAGIPPRI